VNIDLAAFTASSVAILTTVGFKLLGAIIIWFVGRRLIHLCQTLVAKAMNRQHLDSTVISYLRTSLGAVLNIALVVALLGFFGVETTTFAALLAAAGIAIGAAWSGLLSNFAAGIFLIILRPFKVGDFISAGGVTGTVNIIGLFGTLIDTPDNVSTTVGNAKILSDTMQNFSTNSYRRVELTAQLDHSVNPLEAIELLKAKMALIPNVMTTPSPDSEILQFTPAGPLLAVRPYCYNAHYWQVYFDTNKLIFNTFSGAGYPVPMQQIAVRGMAAGAGASVSS
jgi:small conductance mechanosensitive channel